MRPRLFLVLVGMVLAAWPGWAGEGIVALQTGASSCRNQTTNIYVDCGNGTVTDNRTGLVWLKNANCFGNVTWERAMEAVGGLSDLDPAFCEEWGIPAGPCDCGLSDGSSPGEWRLPSASEWRTMISDALGQGGDPNCIVTPPTITNDSGKGCWVSGPSSFSGVLKYFYWSCTTDTGWTDYAWGVVLTGFVAFDSKANKGLVWPVRGGQ